MREENAVGFMFACCGRGKGFYKGKNNVESGAFRKRRIIRYFGYHPALNYPDDTQIIVTFISKEKL